MAYAEDNLHAILGCQTQSEVFRVLQNETLRLGLQSVSWVVTLPIPVNENRIIIHDNYSSAWHERYFDQDYLTVDPTIKHGMTSMLPLDWSNSKSEAPEFWEDARSYGLHTGIAQSMWDRQGCCSMLSMSRDSLDFSKSELTLKLPQICWLAQLAHTGMMRLILPKEIPAAAAQLSAREKEVLKLSASGLTAQQIADRLNLAKRTAEFHLDSIRGKLGVENSTAAAVTAVVLGLV